MVRARVVCLAAAVQLAWLWIAFNVAGCGTISPAENVADGDGPHVDGGGLEAAASDGGQRDATTGADALGMEQPGATADAAADGLDGGATPDATTGPPACRAPAALPVDKCPGSTVCARCTDRAFKWLADPGVPCVPSCAVDDCRDVLCVAACGDCP